MALIKIGIVGYGNLGKGVEKAISQNTDMDLVAIFTRRSPGSVKTTAPVYSIQDIADFKDKIDVMLLCGGSAKDLPAQTPEIATLFNTVDSFDNHTQIPAYFQKVQEQAEKHNKLSLISTGWDPGLFSMMRVLGEAVLPQGKTYTFWGKGLSQGHSDALRRVEGVKLAAQYTIPDEAALDRVRTGNQPELNATNMHKRICYIVANEAADKIEIEQAIKTMPDYFAPYHTEVHFISEADFVKNHKAMPHGGRVLRGGESATNNQQVMEFSLALESNPEFTSSVLVAFARAVYRFSHEGKKGVLTVFDIPIAYLTTKSGAELRRDYL